MVVLAKRVLIHVLGWGFILLGIVGLFLPVLQGLLFLLIGLLILSGESPWAKKLIQGFRKRFPRQYEKVHSLKERMKSRFREAFGQNRKD